MTELVSRDIRELVCEALLFVDLHPRSREQNATWQQAQQSARARTRLEITLCRGFMLACLGHLDVARHCVQRELSRWCCCEVGKTWTFAQLLRRLVSVRVSVRCIRAAACQVRQSVLPSEGSLALDELLYLSRMAYSCKSIFRASTLEQKGDERDRAETLANTLVDVLVRDAAAQILPGRSERMRQTCRAASVCLSYLPLPKSAVAKLSRATLQLMRRNAQGEEECVTRLQYVLRALNGFPDCKRDVVHVGSLRALLFATEVPSACKVEALRCLRAVDHVPHLATREQMASVAREYATWQRGQVVEGNHHLLTELTVALEVTKAQPCVL